MGSLLNEGNAKIYNDVYWQHKAYQTGGIEEMRRLFENNDLDLDSFVAWEKIDRGNRTGDPALVAEGGELFAEVEQLTVIQPVYEKYPAIAKILGIFAFSPVPGARDPFQLHVFGGDLGNREDRWEWTEEILDDWDSALKNRPSSVWLNHNEIINNSKEVCR